MITSVALFLCVDMTNASSHISIDTTTSSALFDTLAPLICIRAQRCKVPISPKVSLCIWWSTFNVKSIIPSVIILRYILFDEAWRSSRHAIAIPCRVSHLALADSLVIELSQPLTIGLKSIFGVLAFVVALHLVPSIWVVLIVCHDVERAGGLAKGINTAIEEARFAHSWCLIQDYIGGILCNWFFLTCSWCLSLRGGRLLIAWSV